MKKSINFILNLILIMVTGCSNVEVAKKSNYNNENLENVSSVRNDKNLEFTYDVNPETFELSLNFNNKQELASKPLKEMKVDNLKKEINSTSWTYVENGIDVVLKSENNYLDVTIKSTEQGDNYFSWPQVEGKSYMLPLWEGKYIPSDDTYWKEYLSQKDIDVIESFSMGFFAVNHENYSIVYIIKNIFNNEISFDTQNNINFNFSHEYVSINDNKDYGFRIYITENDPVKIASIYKDYIIENGNFKTLEQKAKTNKNIEKLYGAVHMYLWDETVISEEDINWLNLRQQVKNNKVIEYLKLLFTENLDNGKEIVTSLNTISSQEYVDKYQKSLISQGLSRILILNNFYDENIFIKKDDMVKNLLLKGIDNLNEVELIQLNKRALSLNMDNIFYPVENWGNDRNIEVLKDIKNSGIDKAWIGLNNWLQGFINPDMVEFANNSGFLIGPYDSYHSIHEPGNEQWNTAQFDDYLLYENATITDKNGKKESGFQNVGRKLNPILSLPSVQKRVDKILNTGVKFNSWFIDCDATGEIYDDYSKEHITTKQEDLEARLKRMAYIRDEKNMVVGSEGGNDFSSSTIAFAHGIELPSFSWMDKDMKENKDSPYYLGKYYSPNGGVAEKFSKQVPVKEKYKKIFLDPFYNLPLFKLVYNNSIITTYHWDWSTFKIKDEVTNRMLKEILYNIPPLYHIDKFEWEKYKDEIVEHSKVFSNFSKEAISKEMTNFKILSDDRLIQMTEYGNEIRVVANFSINDFNYEGDIIEGNSLIIYKGEIKENYKGALKKNN